LLILYTAANSAAQLANSAQNSVRTEPQNSDIPMYMQDNKTTNNA